MSSKSVLEHFTVPDDFQNGNTFKGKCMHCGTLISGSYKVTSNFVTHMKRKHRDLYILHSENKEIQPTLTQCIKKSVKYSPSDPKQLEMTNALIMFIAGDLLPLSIVESEEFKNLMEKADTKYQLKLDLSQGQEFGGGIDNRAGAFVMYNCARLATLNKHFEDNVSKGIYPPLPEISSINFSTLREEDEWELFYNYIFIYGELISETTEQFIPEGSIISKIHTHKVCNFLVSLSRHLSSYYSRTHVLGENREHLLPTMYARLYLLKVTHQIMCHALSLLGITPLNQL
ncbi:DALR anticodon-binding domain-containing protein 3 [Mytilus edulis]|uniref:DALR anticodon-binding domain-containing protein 3 n=1 Tax=Mytilus edulis TaxID=6550 RepID=A0A8S3SFN8_MYTED|nr:DALR anticodon-binding domain-containing protein 3 [Mytilus edulis]